jgi:L-threonylcarbamoyladenylate synthase
MRAALLWRWGEPVAPLRALLARGGLVAFPTESSYALGAHPGNPAGVEAIYRLKRRERGKPLPVVVADAGQLAGLGIDPDLPILLALRAFWPAPLSVALPGAGALPAAAGHDSLAVRIPEHAELRRLLAELGHGLTATSANASGGEPLLAAGEVARWLAGEEARVVDGGQLPGGPPSTLVAPAAAGGGLVVLRHGRFPAERLGALLARE